jgi:hypothetical protein
MFQFVPETQYLLITVILMEARQYAVIERAGLFVIWETGMCNPPERGMEAILGSGDDLLLMSGISTV